MKPIVKLPAGNKTASASASKSKLLISPSSADLVSAE